MTKVLLLWFWYAQLLAWSPPERRHGFIAEAQETPEAARERYLATVEAAVDVVYDPTEAPLFRGPNARQQTLGLMLAVAYTESGFRRDVDLGIGKVGRGDHGRSWCLMQTNIGRGTVPTDHAEIGSWRGPDLVADRRKCFRAGLHLMRRSFGACRDLPLRNRLSAYTSGQCSTTEPNSVAKMAVMARLLPSLSADLSDAAVEAALRPVEERTAERR